MSSEITSEDFGEKQLHSQKEFDEHKAKDLKKYKEEAIRFIEKTENSFVIITAKPIDLDKLDDGISLETRLLSTFVGNMGEFASIVMAIHTAPSEIMQSLAKQMPEEEMNHLLKLAELVKKDVRT
jgi:hypothetical protein